MVEAPATPTDSWTEVRLRTDPLQAPTVSAALIESGATGTWIEEDEGLSAVVAYFAPGVDVPERLGRVQAVLPGLTPFPDAETREVPTESWATTWRSQFQPFRVGQRWSVQAPWHEPSPGHATIEIEPGMAFGTGLHHTTRMCLEALVDLSLEGKIVLDVGTGSGVLAIAACLAGAEEVVAVDCDREALRAATGNVARNGVKDRVHLVAGYGLTAVRVSPDVVVANLTSRGVLELAAELREVLRPGALFVPSGIAAESGGSVESRLIDHGFEIVRRRHAEDWMSFEAVFCPTTTERE